MGIKKNIRSREKELEKRVNQLEKELNLANRTITSYQENQKKNESKYQNLFNGINDAVFVQPFKSKGFANFIDVNESACKRLGYTHDEFLKMSAKDISSKVSLESEGSVNKRGKLLKEKQLIFETIHKTKTGKEIPVEINSKIFEIDGEQIVISLARDITERIDSSNFLKKSEEQYRTFVDNAYDAFYISNSEGKFIDVNSAACNDLGYTKEELLNLTIFDIDKGITKKELSGLHKKLIEQKIEFIERIHTRKNGESFSVEVRVRFFDVKNNPMFLSIARDITQRAKAEEFLKASEKKYRTMIERSNDMIWSLDSNGNITFFNNKVEKIAGLKFSEYEGKSFIPIILEEDIPMLMDIFVKTMSGEVVDYELRLPTPKKGLLIIDTHTAPMYDDNKNIIGVISFGKDITEQKHIENALRESEETSKAILKAIPDLMFVIDKEHIFKSYHILEVNDLYLPPETFVGKKVEDSLPSNLAKITIKSVDKVINTQKVDKYEYSLEIGNKLRFFESRMVSKGKDEVLAIIREITAHKKVENTLRKSEELYRSVFNNSPLGIFHFNSDGILTDCNNKFAEIIGPTREKLLGFNLFTQLESKKIKEEVVKTLENGSGYFEDYYTSVLSKKETPIIAYFNAISNSNNRIVGGVGIVEDITDRKRAEEKLRQSKNKYQSLFEKSEDATIIIKDGKIVDCNLATVKMLRYKEKTEILQMRPSDLSPEKQPDGRNSDEKAEEIIRDTLQNGSNRFEWEHIRADGEIFPVEVLLTPIINENGSQIIHTTLRDITDRKKKEKLQKALFDISEEASKSKTLEDLYKSIHLIVSKLMVAKNLYIAIHNEETDIISFPYYADEKRENREPRKFGKGLTEYVLSKKKSTIITEEIDKKLQEVGIINKNPNYTLVWIGIYLEFGGNYKGVLVVQDYDNKAAYGEDELVVLEFVSQQIVKVIDKKFAETKLKKSLKELSIAKEELEIINKNKDRFFSIIAHDLRSPFMALMGISQMISEDMDNMSVGEVKEMTSSIHHSTQNLNKLIENLLSWSRLQMGAFEIVAKLINLKEISTSVVNILQLSAKEKNITIEDSIQDTNVFADEDCAKAILRNLVNNAIKFTKRGGNIKLSAKLNKIFIEVTVEDTGVGINRIVLEKLFSITEKISEVGTENEIGTGLGLILCKELVEKNGGKIWIESELGVGSKFHFSLPLKKV